MSLREDDPADAVRRCRAAVERARRAAARARRAADGAKAALTHCQRNLEERRYTTAIIVQGTRMRIAADRIGRKHADTGDIADLPDREG